ncbi:histidine phosphatase family protein [Silvibacterium acidisoli]|uniref:histidine phosphatase family protein n=1 Tax=Acidobacteriaceae bacterium ZG23-2 TaxID=2883246 RepID=UPI00406D00B3
MSSRFTLITHAATEAQRHASFPLDEPILPGEIARMSGIHWGVSNSARVQAAPELRTGETAQLLGLEASVESLLRDCDYGHWRGLKMETIQSEDADGLLAWLTEPATAPHGGESIHQLLERVSCWMQQQCAVNHTIAVTHPAVVRAALVCALELPAQSFWRFDIAPLTWTDLRLNGKVWTVRSVGCSIAKTSTLMSEYSDKGA